MAQQKPDESVNLEQLLTLVDKLSPGEQEKLRIKLNKKTWGERWDALVKRVNSDNSSSAALTEQEIYKEFSNYRRELR